MEKLKTIANRLFILGCLALVFLSLGEANDIYQSHAMSQKQLKQLATEIHQLNGCTIKMSEVALRGIQ